MTQAVKGGRSPGALGHGFVAVAASRERGERRTQGPDSFRFSVTVVSPANLSFLDLLTWSQHCLWKSYDKN